MSKRQKTTLYSANSAEMCLEVVLKNSRYFRCKWGHWPVRQWLDAFADFGLIEFDPDGDRIEKTERF